MKLKELTSEELETMGYDEIAYLILEDHGKKMKLLDLFKKVCKILNLPEETIESRIADFFELLSINKKFVLLNNGYWDLAIKHQQDIIIEDEEEDNIGEETSIEDEEMEQPEEDIFYDNDLDDSDEEDDDLKDLVIIDEDENIQE